MYRILSNKLSNILVKVVLFWFLGTTSSVAQPLFAIIGDYGDASANEANVAGLVYGWNPEFIITTGDNLYGSGDYDEAVGQFYCNSLADAGSGIYCSGGSASVNEFFPSLGNHDYDDGAGLNGYLNYFNLPGTGVQTSGTSGNERYYDFVSGSVHFFAIDSVAALISASDRTAQMNWLQTQLAVSTAQWQIVYFHHAPYTSSSHGPTSEMQWPFAAWGVDAVISAHDHIYERLSVDGIVYFVNGLGGASIGDIVAPISGSQVRYNDDYGAMRVDASDIAITFEFLSVSGEIIDTHSIGIPPGLDTDPPTVPGSVSAIAISDSRVDLSWSASIDVGGGVVAGYHVFRSDIGLVGTVTGLSFSDTTVLANTSYDYSVSAFDNVAPIANQSAQSAPPANVVTPGNQQYCTASAGTQDFEFIRRVQVGNIDNPSGASAYSDFTNVVASLNAGTNASVTLSPGFAGTGYPEFWRIWVDYNQDGDFGDSGELVFSGSGSTAVNGNFAVPSTAAGNTRMRISMQWGAYTSACGSFTYGEVEDYSIDITAVTTQLTAEFIATPTTVLLGSSVQFTDQSTGNPTSWSWTFEGGTPAASSIQNPTVNYNTPGTYETILIASNSDGSDSEVKNNYITAVDIPISYCSSSGGDQSFEFISRVQVGDLDNSSAASSYSDFTSLTASLTAGANASLTLSPGFSGNSYPEFWRIWIDFNRDGDFVDTGEQVFSGSGNAAVSGIFAVPGSASGTTRMRVSMQWQEHATACVSFPFGEVEDYSVQISQ